MEMGVLTNQPSVRMTLHPPRLQHQTWWTGSILTGKMKFWMDEFLAKVVCIVHFGILTIPPPVRMTLWPPRLQLLYSEDCRVTYSTKIRDNGWMDPAWKDTSSSDSPQSVKLSEDIVCHSHHFQCLHPSSITAFGVIFQNTTTRMIAQDLVGGFYIGLKVSGRRKTGTNMIFSSVAKKTTPIAQCKSFVSVFYKSSHW